MAQVHIGQQLADQPHCVAIYRINLAAATGRLTSCLTAPELARSAEFRFHADRIRFIAARSALRHILADNTGIHPAAIALTLADRGKPTLDPQSNPNGCQFNLSHSADMALVAVVRGRRVGVDVEMLRQIPRQIAEILPLLSLAEQTALRLTPDADRLTAFFRCWTCKEALIKAVGQGLAIDFAAFSVTVGATATVLDWSEPLLATPRQWSLLALDDVDAQNRPYVATLAVEGPIGPVHRIDFKWD